MTYSKVSNPLNSAKPIKSDQFSESIAIFFWRRPCQGVAIPVKSLPAPQNHDINKEIFEFNASCVINKLSRKWNVCYWNWNVRTLIAVLSSGLFEGKLVAGKAVGVTENWKPKIVLMLNLRWWWWWEVEHIKGWVTGEKKKTVQVVIVDHLLPVVISTNCNTWANIRSHWAPFEEHINDAVPILLNVLNNGAPQLRKSRFTGREMHQSVLRTCYFCNYWLSKV